MNLVSTFPLNTVEDFGPVFITLGAIGEKPDEVCENSKIDFCLIKREIMWYPLAVTGLLTC